MLGMGVGEITEEEIRYDDDVCSAAAVMMMMMMC